MNKNCFTAYRYEFEKIDSEKKKKTEKRFKTDMYFESNTLLN